LSFQFLGHKVDSLEGSGSHVRHSESFILYTGKIFILGVTPPSEQSFCIWVS
jgi:hypothetical protein